MITILQGKKITPVYWLTPCMSIYEGSYWTNSCNFGCCFRHWLLYLAKFFSNIHVSSFTPSTPHWTKEKFKKWSKVNHLCSSSGNLILNIKKVTRVGSFKLSIIFYYLFIYLCMCVYARTYTHRCVPTCPHIISPCGGHRIIYRSQFFLFTMWDLGIEFRSSVFVANSFTHWAVLQFLKVTLGNMWIPVGFLELLFLCSFFPPSSISLSPFLWVSL